ncbi:O-antigen ligase family protein [Actinomadura barringtoniae]|uniref:O-antigen ligase family protein n=1 Tax=Actinomadura barringtoniae TaxID=1427535 RepID=A0A939P783_9ACTN|nr:O-antigen ligase family protein [Actinomadura barringtoniae]MBO2446997.1 O-antigen ligase family protein [Actinomadura barringtoniae]
MTFPALFPRRHRVLSPSAGRWTLVLPLALMLASDYKLRSRSAEQTVGGGADFTVLLEIAVYGAAALFLVWRFGLRPPTRRITGLQFAAWVFAGFVALSALWSPFKSLGTVRAVQLLITMMVAHALATRATRADMRRLAHAFIGIVLVSVAIGVAHPFPRSAHTKDRFNWLFVHPVTAGVYLAIAILLVVGYLIRYTAPWERQWHPAIYVGALAVLSGALIATGTRGAAAGCAVGMLVLLAGARGPRGRIDVIVIGAAVAALGALAFSDKILAFAERGESAQSLASLNSRTELWSLAMKAYSQSPIFGRGLGASRGLFLDDIGLGGGHNAFVNTLVDQGAVGTAAFAVLLLTLAFVLLLVLRNRSLRADGGMVLGILAMFVVDSITTEGLATPANVSGIWLLLLVAWTEVLRRQGGDLPAATTPTGALTGRGSGSSGRGTAPSDVKQAA